MMFPQFLRYSFIVFLFLNLENMLNDLCENIKSKNEINTSWYEVVGNTILRRKKYLHKHANVEQIEDKYWNNIQDLLIVRNSIVHANGNIERSTNRKRLNLIATLDRGITIENNYLVITIKYCYNILFDVSELFRELFEKGGYGPSES